MAQTTDEQGEPKNPSATTPAPNALGALTSFVHHSSPSPGKLGVVVAPAGTGKSALLVQMGLSELISGRSVLHVALGHPVDHVRQTYDHFLELHLGAASERIPPEWKDNLETKRHIRSYMGHSFSLSKLEKALDFLHGEMRFTPEVMILDGLSASQANELAADLSTLAQKHTTVIWLSLVLPAQNAASKQFPTGLKQGAGKTKFSFFATPFQMLGDHAGVALHLEPRDKLMHISVFCRQNDKSGAAGAFTPAAPQPDGVFGLAPGGRFHAEKTDTPNIKLR
jgi:hypothetical protein